LTAQECRGDIYKGQDINEGSIIGRVKRYRGIDCHDKFRDDAISISLGDKYDLKEGNGYRYLTISSFYSRPENSKDNVFQIFAKEIRAENGNSPFN